MKFKNIVIVQKWDIYMEITWLVNIALPYDSYDVSDEPRDYPNPLSRKFASFVNGCKVI